MYRFFLFFLLTLSLNAKMIDGVAIVVQDEPITMMDIKKEMQKTHLSQDKAVDILIREKLEAQEIKKRDISVDEDEVITEIKRIAQMNNMSVSQFYDAVANSQNMTSTELQKEVKKRLLNQKLFQAIAMSSMQEPDDQALKDYFELHKAKFEHPQSFSVIVYGAKQQDLLAQKVSNPMFYSAQISHQDETLEYSKISPALADLLASTPLNGFSKIVPDGKGGYISFYVQSVNKTDNVKLEDVKNEVMNMLMNEKREQALKEYFDRARLSADIKTIRLPDQEK